MDARAHACCVAWPLHAPCHTLPLLHTAQCKEQRHRGLDSAALCKLVRAGGCGAHSHGGLAWRSCRNDAKQRNRSAHPGQHHARFLHSTFPTQFRHLLSPPLSPFHPLLSLLCSLNAAAVVVLCCSASFGRSQRFCRDCPSSWCVSVSSQRCPSTHCIVGCLLFSFCVCVCVCLCLCLSVCVCPRR